jgi:hypothetical protein
VVANQNQRLLGETRMRFCGSGHSATRATLSGRSAAMYLLCALRNGNCDRAAVLNRLQRCRESVNRSARRTTPDELLGPSSDREVLRYSDLCTT